MEQIQPQNLDYENFSNCCPEVTMEDAENWGNAKITLTESWPHKLLLEFRRFLCQKYTIIPTNSQPQPEFSDVEMKDMTLPLSQDNTETSFITSEAVEKTWNMILDDFNVSAGTEEESMVLIEANDEDEEMLS
ncbi:hypothetical protein O181_014022 [Austropuccinia psidii MF-1]|uniref:Uncharacterized protein n=1 Tax=Austropuccinia psidii MF-1 TaxID=1389203 RepID=A0A9Q3BZF0_9BASI|nr:hypothetical protein [Austropuccinia psidii MF-1]